MLEARAAIMEKEEGGVVLPPGWKGLPKTPILRCNGEAAVAVLGVRCWNGEIRCRLGTDRDVSLHDIFHRLQPGDLATIRSIARPGPG